MKIFDLSTLVSVVVARAKVDKTNPNPDNLRAGWQTDELIGHIDLAVVGDEQYATYADFGRGLFEALKSLNLHDASVLAQLAILRGERLQPLTEARVSYIQTLADSTEHGILAMNFSTRVQRCQSLFDYHMSIFADAACDFDRAMTILLKEKAAAELVKDKVRATATNFNFTLVLQKKSIQCDRTADGNVFPALQAAYDTLVADTAGTPHETQSIANSARSVALAGIWLGQTDTPEFRTCVEQAVAAAEKLGSAWRLGVTFLTGVLSKDADKIREVANTDGTMDTNEIIATARLMLVRLALAERDVDTVETLMKGMPLYQVAHIVALANREIKAAQSAQA